MVIRSIYIKKFRGFEEISCDLGRNITVITGQNGTQKTTLLGMLSQTFRFDHILQGEKPLSGGNFRSSFSEKFKFSEEFDTPGSHEWTLHLYDEDTPSFTVESLPREEGRQPIRFWKKGDRSKGSGYLSYPVIYLSLSRLFPIGEDQEISDSKNVCLTSEEEELYKEWHAEILLLTRQESSHVSYLESKQKNTLGINTDIYDWRVNSAGQDNVGKILLAILTFRRLKSKYKDQYRAGILIIDEIDTTLYPAAQLKLLNCLIKFSSKLNLQIFFTTHSLTILEKAYKLQEDEKYASDIKVVFLRAVDRKIQIAPYKTFEEIRNHLNVQLEEVVKKPKITVFVEDSATKIFIKAILKTKAYELDILDIDFSYSMLIELAEKGVNGFKPFESLIVLDGDIVKQQKTINKIENKNLSNVLILPGGDCLERILADFLYGLEDGADEWEKIYPGYNHQLVFSNYKINHIRSDKSKNKKWFAEQKKYWGRNCSNVLNIWIEHNKSAVNDFVKRYLKAIERIQRP